MNVPIKCELALVCIANLVLNCELALVCIANLENQMNRKNRQWTRWREDEVEEYKRSRQACWADEEEHVDLVLSHRFGVVIFTMCRWTQRNVNIIVLTRVCVWV